MATFTTFRPFRKDGGVGGGETSQEGPFPEGQDNVGWLRVGSSRRASWEPHLACSLLLTLT